MKTNGETDPNHKVLEGLLTSMDTLQATESSIIGSVLSLNTAGMPPDVQSKIKSLQSSLPNLVEQMKQPGANPTSVAQNFANQWR